MAQADPLTGQMGIETSSSSWSKSGDEELSDDSTNFPTSAATFGFTLRLSFRLMVRRLLLLNSGRTGRLISRHVVWLSSGPFPCGKDSRVSVKVYPAHSLLRESRGFTWCGLSQPWPLTAWREASRVWNLESALSSLLLFMPTGCKKFSGWK